MIWYWLPLFEEEGRTSLHSLTMYYSTNFEEVTSWDSYYTSDVVSTSTGTNTYVSANNSCSFNFYDIYFSTYGYNISYPWSQGEGSYGAWVWSIAYGIWDWQFLTSYSIDKVLVIKWEQLY